jgi:hypothetical protein
MTDDPLMTQADTLVQSANINAISMYVPLLGRFALLREVDPPHWDFILTIAGVFMAATRLSNLRIGAALEEKLMEKVAERLTEWSPKNGIRAFEDCKAMFERNYDALSKVEHEPKFLASDAVGFWIAWNALGRAPESHDELKLARTVGSLITHAFFNWWSESS